MSEWNVSVEPPSELKSGESSFASKRYINQWIDSLPAAATGETSRRIYLALQEMASYSLPAAMRFYFLEKISALFLGILRNLERGVYRGGFPLSEVNTKTARLLLSMLALVVVNYRLVLAELHSSLLAGGLKRQHIYRHSVLRILEMLGEIFELYRHIDIPPAQRLWALYHRIYTLAEAEKLLHHRLTAMDGVSHTNIAAEYILQQMLEPLNPHDFRHSEYHCMKLGIRILARDIQIQQNAQLDDPFSFCLRLDEDAPLSFFEPERAVQHEDNPQRRCINIQTITTRLHTFLDSHDEGLNLGACQLTRHAARMMLAGWKVMQDNRSQRVETFESIRMAHGLTNIAQVVLHHHLEQGDSSLLATEDEDHEVVVMGHETNPFSFNVEGVDLERHTEQMHEDADLWNTAYVNIVKPAAHWVDTFKKDSGAVIFEGKLADKSPSGYGVLLEGEQKENRFQIGDLIALELENGWYLVTIRWIRRHHDGLRIGLHRLGENIRTQTLVVSRKGKPSQPMPVLHIDHYRGMPAIVLHNINIHPRDRINFVDGDTQVSIEVGDLLDTSAVFECYQLDRQTLQ